MRGNPNSANRPRGRGFTQAGGLLTTRIRKAGAARGFANMRLLTHWEEIVGQELARICQPQKVSYARKGLGARLTLAVKPAHAPEVQMQLPRIKERVNAAYGYGAIAEIRITQGGGVFANSGAGLAPGRAGIGPAPAAIAGFAEAASGFTHDHPATAHLPPAQATRLKATLQGVEDDTLRARLERLGANILLSTTKGHKP